MRDPEIRWKPGRSKILTLTQQTRTVFEMKILTLRYINLFVISEGIHFVFNIALLNINSCWFNSLLVDMLQMNVSSKWFYNDEFSPSPFKDMEEEKTDFKLREI